MVRIREFAEGGEKIWQDWLESRPPEIRAVAEKYPPYLLFKLKSTGRRVTVESYGEKEGGGVSLTVLVTGEFNQVIIDTSVFGIDPDDLEECDLPEGPVGTVLTEEEDVEAFVVAVREGMKLKQQDGK